jgi:hypothetical protein
MTRSRRLAWTALLGLKPLIADCHQRSATDWYRQEFGLSTSVTAGALNARSLKHLLEDVDVFADHSLDRKAGALSSCGSTTHPLD